MTRKSCESNPRNNTESEAPSFVAAADNSAVKAPKVMAFIQGRMSSSRLPAKVLKKVCGKTLLWHMLERVKRAGLLSEVCVLTSSDPSDDPIAEACRCWGVACFRGPLNDVLGRYYLAAQHYRPEHIVRLTADCPLMDGEIIDAVIRQHLEQGNDYTANCLSYTLPDGLDVEVITYQTLEKAAHQAQLMSEREHISSFIRKYPSVFRLGDWQSSEPLKDKRWTVDYPEDFEFVKSIYEALYPHNVAFSWREVAAFLAQNPELEQLNHNIPSNEGLQKSQQHDYSVTVSSDGTVPELD